MLKHSVNFACIYYLGNLFTTLASCNFSSQIIILWRLERGGERLTYKRKRYSGPAWEVEKHKATKYFQLTLAFSFIQMGVRTPISIAFYLNSLMSFVEKTQLEICCEGVLFRGFSCVHICQQWMIIHCRTNPWIIVMAEKEQYGTSSGTAQECATTKGAHLPLPSLHWPASWGNVNQVWSHLL